MCLCYHRFDAAPVFDEGLARRLNGVHDLMALLDPEEEFAYQFDAVVDVSAVGHSFG